MARVAVRESVTFCRAGGAELAGCRVLSLPFHPAISPGDVGRVAGLLREALL
jgi:hypothetical protein